MADNWFSGVMAGAGRGARQLGEGLYNAFVPERENANPTGMTPELLERMQAGEQVTLPPRPGAGETILGMTPWGPASDAWQESNQADQGGYGGGESVGNALFTLATMGVPGAKGLRGKGNALAAPIRAYHGSPHDFDRFDASKIGTGEGAQAYGHGLYFAENEGVAKQYRDTLGRGNNIQIAGKPLDRSQTDYYQEQAANWLKAAKNAASPVDDAIARATAWRDKMASSGGAAAAESADQTIAVLREWQAKGAHVADAGKMYEVGIHADPAKFLDWDKPLSGQGGDVQNAIRPLVDRIGAMPDKNRPVNQARDNVVQGTGSGSDFINRLNYLYTKPGVFPEIQIPDLPAATAALSEAGIPGIRYYDQMSRGRVGAELIDVSKGADGWQARLRQPATSTSGTTFTTSKPYATEAEARAWAEQASRGGTSNFVIFPGQEHLIEIVRKYGLIPVTTAGAVIGAAALPQQDERAM